MWQCNNWRIYGRSRDSNVKTSLFLIFNSIGWWRLEQKKFLKESTIWKGNTTAYTNFQEKFLDAKFEVCTINNQYKVEKILKDSLNSFSSHSLKIQIMDGRVCLRCEGKTLHGVVNKLLTIKSFLTSSSNILPYYLSRQWFEF